MLRFQPNADITAVMSVEGEVLPLKKRIKPSEAGGAVEKWLVQVRPAAAECLCMTCVGCAARL
jgi:hypothetical protein